MVQLSRLTNYTCYIIKNNWDFPGSPVVKTPPSNAEDVGSIPGQGTKIPHAMWSRDKKIKINEKKWYSCHD